MYSNLNIYDITICKLLFDSLTDMGPMIVLALPANSTPAKMLRSSMNCMGIFVTSVSVILAVYSPT